MTSCGFTAPRCRTRAPTSTARADGAAAWRCGEGPADALRAQENVPHGQCLAGDLPLQGQRDTMRRAFVYTPPGYEKDTTTRYPVLYLQHGARGGWPSQGKTNLIHGQPDRRGQSQALIIVMDNYVEDALLGRRRAAPPCARPRGSARPTGRRRVGCGWQDTLLQDIIPMVDVAPCRIRRIRHGRPVDGRHVEPTRLRWSTPRCSGLPAEGHGDPATAHNGVMASARSSTRR